MKTLLTYLRPFARRMSLGFSIKVAGTMVELLLPYILTHILQTVVARERLHEILLWGGVMILCAAAALICNIIANRMAAHVSRCFSEAVRRDLFAATLHLSAAKTDRFTIPSLESRITTDTYHVHNFVGMMQRMGVRAPILLVGGVIITLLMDPKLAMAMIVLLPFIFLTVVLISKKGVPHYTRVQQSVDGMVRIVREDVQGIRVIKALSKNDYENRRYDEANRRLVSHERRAGMTMGIVNPIMTLLMNGGIVLALALAAVFVSDGSSHPETVIAFMQYFTLISMAMMSVGRMFVMYTKCAASARRIAEVLEAEEELPVGDERTYPPVETNSHIAFKNVSFSYIGRKNDLTNISFSLQHGGSLGIIGATGSGKSTLIKLLLRFYDVSEGSIYINGRDVRSMQKDELYSMMGTAMQQDFLYADTIAENIRFGRNLTDEQIEEAARIAQAHEFIMAKPEGYAHMLAQKGTNLSGGQKQRLLIARALAADPAILLLDDSSSALDYKTDAALRQALAAKRPHTTKITVAQRVSSVMSCDLILVLEEGRIIGAGKHNELLATCQAYKEISDSQIGGAFLE